MNHLFKTFEKNQILFNLFVFFAGGYSASYRPLFEQLKGTAEVTAESPPGHGTNSCRSKRALTDWLSYTKKGSWAT
ncbi:hypothetical protein ACEQPO_02625 [Bacillus sp. SL00103]